MIPIIIVYSKRERAFIIIQCTEVVMETRACVGVHKAVRVSESLVSKHAVSRKDVLDISPVAPFTSQLASFIHSKRRQKQVIFNGL